MIKIWCKDGKQMRRINRISFTEDGNIFYIATGSGRDATVHCTERIDVLRNIGLKDIHGKPIYEGDVVRALDSENRDITGRVSYANASFYIEGDSVHGYRWSDYDCEVLGNVYENPDLLGDIDCDL